MLYIDAMNVIGSRPDGWWRDRDGAARRLIDQIREWAQDPVTVVLDAGPDDLLGTVGTVTVVRARAAGATPPTTRSCASSRATTARWS